MTTEAVRVSPSRSRDAGFTLLELLIAVALTSLLILGLVQIASATSTAAALQRNNAELQDHARFAIDILSRAIREAGYRPEPWNESLALEPLGDQTADGVSFASDRLVLWTWSDLNCFGNWNSDRDSEGEPRFYLRESLFDLTQSRSLARQCRYGPSAAELTTQVSRQGWVPDVESFQLLYGEDVDGDGSIERWVKAGQWEDPGSVLGVRVGLLLASAEAVIEPGPERHEVLDAVYGSPADGRLRRVFELAVAIRGRTP